MERRILLSRHVFDRTLALTLTLLLFGGSWYRHASFRSTTYDLAVFEQVVWKMAHGRGATSSLTAWNAFADHLSPVLLAFVPLYRIAATPLWFFAAQAIAVGIAVLCVRPLAAAVGVGDDGRAATVLVAAFALHPSVWNAALYDFHPTTMALPVLLLGCAAALRGQHRHMWLVVVALLFLRDDLGLAAAAVALAGWHADSTSGRRQRLSMVALGLGWTIVGAQVGAAMGASRHFVARYGYLGDSMTDALTHPGHAVTELTRHVLMGDNLFLALALLLPLALLPLRRPAWLAMAVFVAMPALAATDLNFHSPKFHYGAPVVPFLVLAAAGGMRSLDGAWNRLVVLISAPVAAMTFILVGPSATMALTEPTITAADARAALASVRPSDGVAAGTALGPHLANRDDLLPFPYPFASARLTFPLDERVTARTPDQQERVDVILLSNIGTVSQRLLDRVAATDEVREKFTRADFGTVTVFRRRA